MHSAPIRRDAAYRLPVIIGLLLALGVAGAIAGLPEPVNLAVVPAILAGVALLLVVGLAPILLVASVPVQEAGAIPLAGGAVTVTQTLVAATLAVTAIHLLTRGERVPWTPLVIPYAAYLATLAISLQTARDLGAGIAELYRWTVPLVVLLALLYAIRSRRAILALFALVALGASTQALLGGVQAVLGLGPPSFAVTGSFSRAYGTFGRPNTYGAFLELAAMLLIPIAIWATGYAWHRLQAYRRARPLGFESSRRERWSMLVAFALSGWLAAGAALSLVGVGISFSRGAWLGTAAGILAMMLVASARTRLAAGIGVVLVAVVVASGGLHYVPEPLRSRLVQLGDQSPLYDVRHVMVTDENFAVVERVAHWQTGMAMFWDQPWTGVGVGNFNAHFTEYAVHPGFLRSQGHAHNYYIHAAAETGLPGLIAYLALLGTAAVVALRAARRAPDRFGRALGLAAVGTTAALAVHNVFENLHVLNLSLLVTTSWALAIIALRAEPGRTRTTDDVESD